MQTIHFQTVIKDDGVIRPPNGLSLPQGLVDVVVKATNLEIDTNREPWIATRAWLLALAQEAEQAGPNLPPDLAEHHDHYAHGKPLP